MKFLYLDDLRSPKDPKWEVVRNYDEFCSWLEKEYGRHGFFKPTVVDLFISFDHDLADEHYTPEHLWTDYSGSVKHQDAKQYQEKTGLDCAKVLADYNIIPSMSNSHSWNPVGQAAICGFIDGWYRFNGINDMIQKFLSLHHNFYAPQQRLGCYTAKRA